MGEAINQGAEEIRARPKHGPSYTTIEQCVSAGILTLPSRNNGFGYIVVVAFMFACCFAADRANLATSLPDAVVYRLSEEDGK